MAESGAEIPEGILDGVVTALAAMHDLKRTSGPRTARTNAARSPRSAAQPPAPRAASSTNSGSMNAIGVRVIAARPRNTPARIGRRAAIDAHA